MMSTKSTRVSSPERPPAPRSRPCSGRDRRERVGPDRRVGQRWMQRVAGKAASRGLSFAYASFLAGAAANAPAGTRRAGDVATRRLFRDSRETLRASPTAPRSRSGQQPPNPRPRSRRGRPQCYGGRARSSDRNVRLPRRGLMGRTAYLPGRRASLDAAIPHPQSTLRHGSPERGGAPRRCARAGHRRALPEEGDDLPEVARRANADVLGMAGGDGSLAAVADVAIEQDIPFVCIPFGTRNHFARDIGLDRDDPIGASRRSTAKSGGSMWAGSASALPEQRLARPLRPARAPARAPPPAREALARLRALALTVKDRRRRQRFTIDGEPVRADSSSSRTTPTASTCFARRARATRRGDPPPVHPARVPAHHLGGAELHGAQIGSPLPRLRAASTASRSSSKRRSGSGSSRAHYACCCRARQSERIST